MKHIYIFIFLCNLKSIKYKLHIFDHKFIFDSKAVARERFELRPLPKLSLRADVAVAIGKGFVESKLDTGIRVTCWFHCKKGVDLIWVKDIEKKSALLDKFYQLQVCQAPYIFKPSCKLFV